MLRKLFVLLLPLLFLAACAEPNPIVGVWVIDGEASSTGAAAAAGLAGVNEIEFREDKLVIDKESVEVGYEIDGERVIVTRTAEGRGEVYTLTEEDRLEAQLPMGIVVVYRRAPTTPPVAAEPTAQP